MRKATLKKIRISNINFVNNAPVGAKLELGHTFSYNVKYSKQGLCTGNLTAKYADKKDPKAFSMTMVIQGVFSIDAEASKEELHVETYNEMSTFARSYVASVTAIAGIPPVYMPFIDISNQKIFHVDMDAARSQIEDMLHHNSNNEDEDGAGDDAGEDND